MFENPETTENFHKLISRGTKTIYLILSTFLGILCVQGTTLNLLLKVINEHLLLLLESGFSGYYSQKWYLDSKLVAFQQFSGNGNC